MLSGGHSTSHPGPQAEPVTSQNPNSGWGRASGEEESAGPRGEFRLDFKAELSKLSAELLEGRPSGHGCNERTAEWGTGAP